jgi:hypothetical protein
LQKKSFGLESNNEEDNRRQYLSALSSCSGCCSLYGPAFPKKPSSAEIQAPLEVRQVLEKSCYSCHSDQRQLSWFDQIQPAYWVVRKDILTGREHLDFSTLGSKPAAAQKGVLYEAVNMIQLGAMPLPRFLALHPEAMVSSEDLAALKAYLSQGSIYETASNQ